MSVCSAVCFFSFHLSVSRDLPPMPRVHQPHFGSRKLLKKNPFRLLPSDEQCNKPKGSDFMCATTAVLKASEARLTLTNTL